MPFIIKLCQKCDKEFKTHTSHVNIGQGKYCSRSCARSGSPTKKKILNIIKCKFCSQVFSKHKSEIKKSKQNLHFCSPECWHSFNQKENHYLWSGGQSERMSPEYRKWKKSIHVRDKYLCRCCLSGQKIRAHHILPFSKYKNQRWDINNGITLCHNCHVKTYQCEEKYVELLNFIRSRDLNILYIDENNEIENPEELNLFFQNCKPDAN